MKADLHLHSEFSWDSKVKIEDYIKRAAELELGAIAITDHNSTESHNVIKNLQLKTSVILIPGQEVSTSDGHLLVYGYLPQLEPNLSMKDTVESVKQLSQDQIFRTVAAHPFDRLRKGSGKIALTSGVTGLEVLNASALFSRPNKLALKNAPENFAKLGNSDSHRLDELGFAHSIIPKCNSYEQVLKNLDKAVAKGSRIGLRRKTKRFVIRKFRRNA